MRWYQKRMPRHIYHDPQFKAQLVKEAIIRAVNADQVEEIAGRHRVPREELENWISNFLDNFDYYFSDKLLIDKLILRPLQKYSEEPNGQNAIDKLINNLNDIRRYHREFLRNSQFDYSELNYDNSVFFDVDGDKEFLIDEFVRRTVKKYLGIYVYNPAAYKYYYAKPAVLEDFFPTSELVYFGSHESFFSWLSIDPPKMKLWLGSTLEEMNRSKSTDFDAMKDLIYFLYLNKVEDILGKPFEEYLDANSEFGKVLLQMRIHYAEKLARQERHRQQMEEARKRREQKRLRRQGLV